MLEVFKLILTKIHVGLETLYFSKNKNFFARYYRRAGTVSKKPSALCLPTSCQPDPAIYRRTRRTPADTQYQQQEVSKPTATEQTDINKMDSRGDVNATTTDLDHMLARYEKIFSEIPNTSRKSEATATALKNVGMLKPRVSRIFVLAEVELIGINTTTDF